jgi:hypothetical protein
MPFSNPEHWRVANLLMLGYNNLGVTYYRQGSSSPSREQTTRAIAYLTYASEYMDLLSRDPETLERSEARNLAYINTNGLLHPTSGFEPSIYERIPKDPEAGRF